MEGFQNGAAMRYFQWFCVILLMSYVMGMFVRSEWLTLYIFVPIEVREKCKKNLGQELADNWLNCISYGLSNDYHLFSK